MRSRPSHNKPTGTHIPKMLAQTRRSAEKYQPATSRRCADVGGAVVDHKWKTLLVVLVVTSLVARQTGLFNASAPKETLHDQSVAKLPSGTKCTDKQEGISTGKICNVEGTTHYMKIFPQVKSTHEVNALPTKSGIVCYEEFNRQFVKNNIGANVPMTKFFKQTTKPGVDALYIGSAMIEGLEFATSDDITDKQLGPKGVARLAVASTFITDLHKRNWGYNKDGLVLIDVDAVDNPPRSIDHYLLVAELGLNHASMPLSLYNVRQMKGIYENMRHIPLPKFHEDFHLTKGLYSSILDIYIHACQATIDQMRKVNPRLKSDKALWTINQELTAQILSQKNTKTYKI